ncbi:MAG: glycogen/starch synthase [Patescibacteria group bacterium]|nr:glycogen/starch synthase [Patescibacteria group bacterium]
MKVLFSASECESIVKVGGLADVVASLSKALKKLGVDVSITIPFYGVIKKEGLNLLAKEIPIHFTRKIEKFSLWQGSLPETKIPVYLIENQKYLSKGEVYIESDASAGGSAIEARRFLFFSVALLKMIEYLNLSLDILHCHDWHVGIVPFLIKKEKRKIKTLLTIHNLGYQGIYPPEIVNQLLKTNFSEEVNCLKEGILKADFINTVSPNYAKEILTEKYGYGLENYLKKRKKNLVGILNGLDTEKFNPQTDFYLRANYSIKSLEKKIENKIFLQKKYFKKARPSIPLLGIVSRLAEQKGMDLIEEIFPQLMKEKLQFILLGKGQKIYENFFQEMTKKFPQKFLAKIAFDEELAQQIYAGADIFLMPSLFEPCGLGQMIALRYGTLPLARATGGIKDTVEEIKTQDKKVKGSGFLFENYEPKEFLETIKNALRVYQNKKIWRQIQIKGMLKDFSWQKSAKEYLKLYQKILI